MMEIALNSIEGFRIGHATDLAGATGCTAVLCPQGAVGGVDVRGGAPASRETELLKPVNMVDRVHGVMLSGGSAYGLDACGGAMAYLEERGIGFDVGVGVVPIVCGASLFDLAVGDPKARPDRAMGYAACVASEANVPEEGNAGAGTGATVGKFMGVEYVMKSGIGMYAVRVGDVKIGAIVAVNALGDVIDVDTGEIIAGMLNEEKTGFRDSARVLMESVAAPKNVFSDNTTLGCVLTNAKLTKSQANRTATVAHNGYARSVRPVHTTADGDTVFVLATGEVEVAEDALGALASEVVARAVNRAARAAKTAFGIRASVESERKR